MRSKRVQVKCDYCGKEFKRCSSIIGKHSFCSHSCYSKWLSKNIRGEKSPAWRGGRYKRCEVCEKRFWVKPSELNTARFCSVGCKRKWQTENLRGEKHPLWKRVEIPCGKCGLKFWVKPFEIGVRRFCSRRCKAKWASEHYSGKNSPMYGKHISEQLKRKLLEANLGKTHSEEHKRKISMALMGKNNPFYGKHHSDEFKRRKSETHRKWMREHGPVYPKPYYVEELGHPVRSKWEEEIGLLMKGKGIDYQGYEVKTFEVDGRSYTPDFIIDDKTVLEVKGYLPDREYTKYAKFTDAYPELTFIIVGGPKRCEKVCDIYIPWKDREKLVEVLS